MHIYEALDRVEPGFLKRLQSALSEQALNPRIEQQYRHWIARFLLFHGMPQPASLQPDDEARFLEFIESENVLSRAKLNIVRQALAFLFEKVTSGDQGIVETKPSGKVSAAG